MSVWKLNYDFLGPDFIDMSDELQVECPGLPAYEHAPPEDTVVCAVYGEGSFANCRQRVQRYSASFLPQTSAGIALLLNPD